MLGRQPQETLAGVNTVRIEGSFAPNGTGAPTTLLGKGFTVARAAQGVFTVTLTSPVSSFISVVPGVCLQTAAARIPQVTALTTGSTPSFQISNLDTSAVAQDIAAAAGNTVHFTVVCRAGSP